MTTLTPEQTADIQEETDTLLQYLIDPITDTYTLRDVIDALREATATLQRKFASLEEYEGPESDDSYGGNPSADGEGWESAPVQRTMADPYEMRLPDNAGMPEEPSVAEPDIQEIRSGGSRSRHLAEILHGENLVLRSSSGSAGPTTPDPEDDLPDSDPTPTGLPWWEDSLERLATDLKAHVNDPTGQLTHTVQGQDGSQLFSLDYVTDRGPLSMKILTVTQYGDHLFVKFFGSGDDRPQDFHAKDDAEFMFGIYRNTTRLKKLITPYKRYADRARRGLNQAAAEGPTHDSGDATPNLDTTGEPMTCHQTSK